MTKLNPILPNIQSAWNEAKPFQIEDAEFVVRNGRVVVGHKTGLGKTFISLLAWSRWTNARKALLIGTLGSVATWMYLLDKWAGARGTFLRGYSDSNWKKAINAREGIFFCTYSTFLGLMKATPGKPAFDVLFTDELHKYLRHKTSTHKAIARLDTENYVGLSATWGSKGPQDLWPVLNIANRNLFSSYWRFVETWCYVENTNFGKEVYGVRNADNLRKILYGQYYTAKTWEEVGYQFGYSAKEPVVRRSIELDMQPQQAKLHQELEEEMYAELDGNFIVTSTVLAKLTRLLQLAVSPTVLFPRAEVGIAFRWLIDKVEEDSHTVIFSPFTETLTQFELYAKNTLQGLKTFTLRGGMDPEEVYEVIRLWKEARGLMLCTISFAQSFPLDTTNNAYMLGFDWDPNNNIQAEGRLRRLDSILKTPCSVTYIVVKGSKYEDVKEVVNGKTFNMSKVLKGYNRIRRIES